ncbi:MAG: DUF1554 domain-containing protein [Pseudomonadota bacterium]
MRFLIAAVFMIFGIVSTTNTSEAQTRLWSSADTGNSQFGANFGGRAGADTFCQANIPANVSAFAATAGVRTIAFLSIDATDEIRDLPLTANVPTNETIFRADGTTQIATNFAALLDTTTTPLNNSIAFSAVNATPMTGSFGDGSVDTANTCSGFASGSNSDQAAIGAAGDVGPTYLRRTASLSTLPCDFLFSSLYCITFMPAAATAATPASATGLEW